MPSSDRFCPPPQLPLDDLVSITHRFIHADASCSGISLLLRRAGIAKLQDIQIKVEDVDAPKKTFKDYAPGFVCIDINYLPQMPDEARRRYLFVAVDRATPWVYPMKFMPSVWRAGVCNPIGFIESVALGVKTANPRHHTDIKFSE